MPGLRRRDFVCRVEAECAQLTLRVPATSGGGLQDGLGQLGLIDSDLYALHAGDRDAVLRWLNTPNRALKERAGPRTLLERGQVSVLEALVDAMKRRQPL